MIYLYQTTNPAHNLVKIGITKHPKGGKARIGNYARKHQLPREGWTPPRHYALDTDDIDFARMVEGTIHAQYRARYAYVTPGGRGRPLRECFKGTASGAHWTCLKIAKGSGKYVKQSDLKTA